MADRTLYSLILALCTFPFLCYGIDTKPWLGNLYEFVWDTSYLYQGYPKVAEGSSLRKYSSDDFFLSTSLSNTFSEGSASAELEIVAANTRKQRGIDHFSLAGRYSLLDDIAGDSVSLVTGLSLSVCTPKALKDISSFHHGRGEAELYLSLGSELERSTYLWLTRWWAVTAVGIADRGSSWLRANGAYEFRLGTFHEFRVFMDTLWGLGHHKLRVCDFDGYGNIQHQSIDLGFRYTYLIEFFGHCSFEYSYRPYSRNFPAQTHRCLFFLVYTFGL